MEMQPMNAPHAPQDIPPPPPLEDVTGDLTRLFRAVGGLAGSMVLISSILLSVSSVVAIMIAAGDAEEDFQNKSKIMGHWFTHPYLSLSYSSVVEILLSLMLEHGYIYIITRTEAILTEQEGPRTEWIPYFKFMLPFCWLSFLATEIFLIAIIVGLHHRVFRMILSQLTALLDIVTIVLSTFLHFIAVKINWSIAVRDRINALAELSVDQENVYEDCSICLDTPAIGDIIRGMPCCGCIFHKMCVDRWLIKRPRCPHCRQRL